MTNQEPKPLNPSHLLSILVVLGSIATWVSWSWWNSKGLFKITSLAEKIERTDYTKGIRYVVPSVGFSTFVENPDPATEWAVEYSDNSAVMAANQKKKQLDHRRKQREQANRPPVAVITPFWRIDFQLPEGVSGKARPQAIQEYFVRKLEDSIVAEGEHLLPYARPDREQEKVMRSSCASLMVDFKAEEQNGLIYFQVTTRYSRFVHLQLDHSPLVSVNPGARVSEVYIGTKKNTLASMKSIMQNQVKEILAQLRSQPIEVEQAQYLPPAPNYHGNSTHPEELNHGQLTNGEE